MIAGTAQYPAVDAAPSKADADADSDEERPAEARRDRTRGAKDGKDASKK